MNVFFDKCNFESNQQNVIVHCDKKYNFTNITYSQMQQICEILENNLKLHKNYVGLYMEHNVYLPSLLISLFKMKCPFVFLNEHNKDDLVHNIGINYIIGFNQEPPKQTFNKVKEINLNPNINLVLWENSLKYLNDIKLDLFCVVSTTGTTGQNKVIKVPVKCIEDNSVSLRKIFGTTQNDIIFWGTPLTFDPSLIEFLIAIESKATLFIVSKMVYLNPNTLYKALFGIKNETFQGITFLQMVPSVFLRWSNEQIKNIFTSQLRILALGGEAFPDTIFKIRRSENLRLFNLYGISELSCWATINEIPRNYNECTVSIGNCIGDTLLEILPTDLNNAEVGELCIRSKSRFCVVDNRDWNVAENMFRKTGDLVRNTDKGIFYIGRTNNIIKRFGHRVNLTKIDDIIKEETGLTSISAYLEDQKQLIIFFQIENFSYVLERQKTIDKIRVKLLKILSKEMYPDLIEIINKLPLNKHGKIDTKYMTRTYANSLRNVQEKNLLHSFLWSFCKYLGISAGNVQDYHQYRLSDVGGNSIVLTQILNDIQDFISEDDRKKLIDYLFENTLGEIVDLIKKFKTLKRKLVNINTNKDVLPSKKVLVQTEYVLRIKWSYDLKACVDSTPLIFEFNGKIYIAVGSFSNIFVILDSNGNESLKFSFEDNIEAMANFSNQFGLLFIGCFDGNMHCINFNDKTLKWSYKTEDRIKSTPCFCQNEALIIFGSYDKYVYCIQTTNGQTVWKTLIEEPVACNPILDKLNMIYLTSITGTVFCLNVENGGIVWKYLTKYPIFGSPVLMNDQNIIIANVDGTVNCIYTNGLANWTYKLNGNVYSSAKVYGDSVFVTCHDYNVHRLSVNHKTAKLDYNINLGAPISSSINIINIRNKEHMIATNNNGQLFLSDINTGSILNNIKLPGDTFCAPVACDENIYVGCRDNNLYCIEICKI